MEREQRVSGVRAARAERLGNSGAQSPSAKANLPTNGQGVGRGGRGGRGSKRGKISGGKLVNNNSPV